MSDAIDEVVTRMRNYAQVERVMGTEPDDMAIACLDVVVRLHMANAKSLRQAQELLAWTWEFNHKAAAEERPLHLVVDNDA